LDREVKRRVQELLQCKYTRWGQERRQEEKDSRTRKEEVTWSDGRGREETQQRQQEGAGGRVTVETLPFPKNSKIPAT